MFKRYDNHKTQEWKFYSGNTVIDYKTQGKQKNSINNGN